MIKTEMDSDIYSQKTLKELANEEHEYDMYYEGYKAGKRDSVMELVNFLEYNNLISCGANCPKFDGCSMKCGKEIADLFQEVDENE